MANPITPVVAAIRAISKGVSGRAALRQFRADGGRIATATFQRTIAEVRRTIADQLDEATRPLNRRPTADEITTISSAKHSGYRQHVDVYVRDRTTGEVESRPFSWKTQVVITRQAAINQALFAFQDGVTGSPDRFNEEILGATYTGTIQLIPRGTE